MLLYRATCLYMLMYLTLLSTSSESTVNLITYDNCDDNLKPHGLEYIVDAFLAVKTTWFGIYR